MDRGFPNYLVMSKKKLKILSANDGVFSLREWREIT